MTRFHFLIILSFTAFVAACGGTYPAMRSEIAQRLGSAAFMVPRDINAGPFTLLSYERMHERAAPANIYIEGDGPASGASIYQDPTPVNPVALHLATRDKAENVAWIGRPCQYRWEKGDGSWCDKPNWRENRFSPEVIAAYNDALDDIKARYTIDEFNIIGFGGGASVAAILAAQRDDVVTLRSVAGNLDPDAYVKYHQSPAMVGSLNPVDFADRLSDVPQYHFLGGQDKDIPPAIYHSYIQALGNTNCVRHDFIQEAEHQEGWVDKWPGLLKRAPICKGPVDEIAFDDFYLPPEPIRIQRELPKGK